MLARAARIGSVLGMLVAPLVGGCGNSGDGAQPDAPAQGDAQGTPDAAPLPSGVVAVPLASIGGGYSGPLRFGAETFQAIVDTGSSSTGVAAATCTGCNVQPEYATTGAAVDKHQTASSTYGDGTGWKGEVFEDTASIGDGPAVALDFAAIQSSQGFFRQGSYQGIIGLGPDAALLPHTTSYVTTAIQKGMAPQIAFQLCPDSGTMWLGGYDPAATTAPPVFTPMVSGAPYDMVRVGGASVGGADFGVTGADFGPTIIDTGTTMTFVPTAVLTKLVAAISAAPGYSQVFGTQKLDNQNCLTTTKSSAEIDAAMPPLGVAFPGAAGAGASAPIAIPATRAYLFAQGGGSYCFSVADSSQLAGSQKVSLIGNTLLAGMITIIDTGTDQIGFAPQTGCAQANVAHAAAVVAPVHAPGQPWWRNDPRVRLPAALRL